MAATPSTMLALGTAAPAFSLPDAVTGRSTTLKTFEGSKALVVMFLCNHCPFVKHVRGELARVARDYQARGVGFVAISSNDVENYPEDAPAKMKEQARDAGYTFPYLFDEAQSVAKAYRAACTPDFFVFDASRRLAYRGRLDDSRPPGKTGASTPVTGADLRAALDAVLAGRAAPAEQKPSIGCNIKWKPGNEPDYYGG
ncbi:MAG: thioredoxin family protein [Phycisphaerae bacterium]|nr:thioredoxin family protein [Phycisphaerae bacterium]